MMFTHEQTATSSSGRAEIPGDDSIVSLGSFIGMRGSVDQQFATALHEGSHLVGNNHNGRFDDPRNCNGNHYSVLNYFYQFANFDPGRVAGLSDETMRTLDEDSLDDLNAIRQVDGTPPDNSWNFLWRNPFTGIIHSEPVTAGVIRSIDFDQDGNDAETNKKLNINNIGFSSCANDVGPNRDTLVGANDWGVQNYLHRSSTNFQLGVESLNPLDPEGPNNSFSFFEISSNTSPNVERCI